MIFNTNSVGQNDKTQLSGLDDEDYKTFVKDPNEQVFFNKNFWSKKFGNTIYIY